MTRTVSLFTGPWSDHPLEDLCRQAAEWGCQALELATWNGHFDVGQAALDPSYCVGVQDVLDRYDLACDCLAVHPLGHALLDRIEDRHRDLLPGHVWGDGDPAGVNERAAEELKTAARAAQKMGLATVNGFLGSTIRHLLCAYPPASADEIDAGYALMAQRLHPVLDEFAGCGVRFSLQLHPSQMAFDVPSARRVLAALEDREEIGFTLDPSHFLWQGVDPVEFIAAFPERIFHVHVKDAFVQPDGGCGVVGSYLNVSQSRRGWAFRSPGRGGVPFEEIIRALNHCGYEGSLCIDWEDPQMGRAAGAEEACRFVKQLDFPAARVASAAAVSEDG